MESEARRSYKLCSYKKKKSVTAKGKVQLSQGQKVHEQMSI